MFASGRQSAMPPMAALDTPPWRAASIALAVALLAQATILHALRFRGGSISVVLLLVVWFAARARPARGAFFGLIAGVCEDAMAGDTGAAWTIATPLAAAAAGYLLRRIDSNNPLVFGGVVGFASLARTIACWFVLRAEGLSAGFDRASFDAALVSAVLDALVAVVVLTVLPQLRPLRVDGR